MTSDSIPQPSAPPAPEALGGAPQATDAAYNELPPEDQERYIRLKKFLEIYEISVADVQELVLLQNFDIVFIADDSSSMNQTCSSGERRTLFQHSTTRWDELRDTIASTIELASCVVDGDIDLFFLNRERITKVQGKNDPRVTASMLIKPSGLTPLTEKMREVIEGKADNERPVLVIVATDGEPNGGVGPLIRVIENAIHKRNTNTTFKFQILACTDDDESVSWMDSFDNKYKEVDVTDDYISERTQVLKAGKVQKFTRTDWIMKALLGPICEKFDSLDEKKKISDQPYHFILFIILALLWHAFVF